MRKLWSSVAFRLAVSCGLLAVGSTMVVAAVFYFGTVGVVARGVDEKLQLLSDRLTRHYASGGATGLGREIEQLLHDGIDQDTEVYSLIGPEGQVIAGNLAGWSWSPAGAGGFEDRKVIRAGRPSLSRLLPRQMPDGAILVVGRDLDDQVQIKEIVWRALSIGAVCAAALAALGALLFRRQLEARIAAIHRTAREIEAGDLSRRVPIPAGEDEFARLGRDINRMLDQIEHLMDGVRHVSNSIAHDLRTPLSRIRSQLEEALHPGERSTQLVQTARDTIVQIDELIQIFDRLLQIAEAESGIRRQSFIPVRLEEIIGDVIELYDAAAEVRGITLLYEANHAVATLGDRNLLANAVANLIDNALKYAGDGASIRVWATRERDSVSVIVEDDGPGIPPAERPRVVERFYRLDTSRTMPGNGLGLSIVSSIAALHNGSLRLEDAAPGLRARLDLPAAQTTVPARSAARAGA